VGRALHSQCRKSGSVQWVQHLMQWSFMKTHGRNFFHILLTSWYAFPAEKAMASHSSTLAWKIPWTEEPGRLQCMGSWRVGHDWATSLSLFTSCIGEGNGNPLQCSCLENPRDGGAWWASVYGVSQSQTWLKRLSSAFQQQQQCFSWTTGLGKSSDIMNCMLLLLIFQARVLERGAIAFSEWTV